MPGGILVLFVRKTAEMALFAAYRRKMINVLDLCYMARKTKIEKI